MPLDDAFDAMLDGASQQQRRAPTPPKPGTGTPPPFRALGHDRGRYFVWSMGAQQVVELRARDLHSLPELNRLAPLAWWEAMYPGGKESFQVRAAGNALLEECHARGIFDPDCLRGRGVWFDAGRVVAHLGNRLLVDGQPVALGELESDRVYEQGRRIALGDGPTLPPALTDAEGRALLECCRALSWEDADRDGSLLAGWIACAILGGGLHWRPHLWITSEAGSGKSWVFDNVIKPALGRFSLWVQGKSSEAGIRGALGSDVLAVCFDEAESQNEADRARMQQVLDLARQAVSGDNAPIAKGKQDGTARLQYIRSCFALGSINLALSQAGDETRFIALALGQGSPEQFAELKRRHAKAMVPQLGARLFVRLIGMVPTVRANAETLADAIARSGATRRAGDVLGATLAGGLALTSDRRLTAAQADKLVAQRAWVRQAAAERTPEPEWQRILIRLMQHPVRFVSRGGRPDTASVAELADVVRSGQTDSGRHNILDADDALRRMGIRVMPEELRIANRAPGVDDALRGSPWAVGWHATLKRAPGAKCNVATRFHALSSMSKALSIPLKLLTFDEPEPEPDVAII